MGTGPIPASKKCFDRAGLEAKLLGRTPCGPWVLRCTSLADPRWSVKDLDLVEANEAFAAQAMRLEL